MSTLPQRTDHTFAEVIRLAEALNPEDAVDGRDINRRRCVTPLIERVDGQDLFAVPDEDGRPRYGAALVRVSTPRQYALGFSISDQIKNAVRFYANKKQSFRIYSDATLSGSLPYLDAALVAKMIEERIKRYRRVFRRVFLSRLRLQHYEPGQEASVRAYLARQTDKMRNADPIAELDLRPRRKQKLSYRPGLTLLMNDLPETHTVAVNDLTRLSRNQNLFAAIMEQFEKNSVRVVGLMESLDFLNVDEDSDDVNEIGSEMQAWFLAKMAEYKLRETTMGVLRGHLEMLEQGKPHGKLPCWLLRITDDGSPDKGKAALKCEGVDDAIRQAIDLFVDKRLGTYQVCKQLNEGGVSCPSDMGVWTYDVLEATFTSRALCGMEESYGLEFPIFPRIISDQRWRELQRRWDGRDKHQAVWGEPYRNNPDHKTKYLATGLIKCVCAGSEREGRGGALVKRPGKDPQKQLYVCGNAARKKHIKHINLRQPNVDAFIDGLIASDPIVLFGEYSTTAEYQALTERLIEVERLIDDAEVRRAGKRSELRPDVEKNLVKQGYDRTDPDWPEFVDKALDNRMRKEPVSVELGDLRTEQARNKRSLTHYMPPEHRTSIEERIRRWNDLEVWEKNDLLLRMFDRWYFREIDGDPKRLEMVMVLHGGREIRPAVPITVIDKGRSIWRRLPDAAEWIAAVIREQHRLLVGQT